jgi:hypothetical protein
MAIARSKLVDVSVARWYHGVSRCIRKAFLLGTGESNRKDWLENRLEELADVFAVAVGGFSVMDGVGRLHGSPLSQGKGLDFGGDGRDVRAAGL